MLDSDRAAGRGPVREFSDRDLVLFDPADECRCAEETGASMEWYTFS